MKAIRIILLALIIIGVGLMLTEDRWIPKVVDAILKSEGYSAAPAGPSADAASAGTTCFDSPGYFAIQKNNADSPGSDIVIKHKANADQQIPCEYSVSSGDFEIKNQDADYFLAFAGDFALIDSGTGPEPRGLTAYSLSDLSTKAAVFSDQYSKPIAEQGSVISYWSTSAQAATAANCPDLAQNSANGLRSIIENQVTIDLKSPSKKETGSSRCEPAQ